MYSTREHVRRAHWDCRRLLVRTWYVGVDGFTLLVERCRCGTGFSSRIQVLLTTEFFARKLTDGYGINIRKLNVKVAQVAYH